MDVKDWVSRVESKLHVSNGHLKGSPFVHQAILETLPERRSSDTDDALCARAAQRTVELNQESRAVELQHTPTDRVFGDALVRALAPRIENLRREGFGNPDPPFENTEEAAEWVEETSKAVLASYRERSEERKETLNKISKLADEYQIEIKYESTLLPYLRNPSDDNVKWASTVRGSYLYRLARETHRIAKHTGLPQEDLVVHVLTGLKPIRSRARLATRENAYTLPSGEQIRVNEATVTFYARDLTYSELRRIYNAVRGHVSGKGAKGLEDKDEDLWNLVQDLGGPPEQHGIKGRFWRTVQETMNRKYPGQYTTSKGVQQRYFNILERLRPPQDD